MCGDVDVLNTAISGGTSVETPPHAHSHLLVAVALVYREQCLAADAQSLLCVAFSVTELAMFYCQSEPLRGCCFALDVLIELLVVRKTFFGLYFRTLAGGGAEIRFISEMIRIGSNDDKSRFSQQQFHPLSFLARSRTNRNVNGLQAIRPSRPLLRVQLAKEEVLVHENHEVSDLRNLLLILDASFRRTF